MNKFLNFLENSEHEKALSYLNENKDILRQKTEDGWNTLQLAAYYNSPTIIEFCLSNLTYEEINSAKQHPLSIAIEEKNIESIKSFLNFDNSTINYQHIERNGDNFLHLTIFYGLYDVAKSLIEKDVSTTNKNNQGVTPIQLTIDKGQQELFDIIYEKINLSDYYSDVLIKKSIQNDNPIIFERLYPYSSLSSDEIFNLATGFKSVKVLSTFLEEGDIIPGQKQITQIVDLMCSKYENKDDILASQKLADYLFEINTPFNSFVNEQGQSAWMLCIKNDNLDIFERLLKSKESVNIADTELHTPLFYAIEKNNLSFVKLLLHKNANPKQVDKNKNTPLMKAVELGNYDMVKEILKYPQLINETNNNNEHALSIAIKKRRMDIVGELIWAGGEITTNPVKMVEEKQMFFFGANGATDRNAYFEEEQIDNFIALTKLGFKLNQTNKEGDTFLLHFIKNGYISNFSALMKCHFNPNQNDVENNSAIMCAASKKQDIYFSSMIKKFSNIDFSVVNDSGENVYDICFKVGKHERMEQLLLADTNISVSNAQKTAKLIAKDGDLSKHEKRFKEIGLELNFLDQKDNSLLMFTLLGGNFNNFKYLVEKVGIDVKQKNKLGHSIIDMINSMPEETSKKFKSFLKLSTVKKI